MIGDNVRIGTPVNAGAGIPGQQRINYNNGGIQINGPTEFDDRYFKADERFSVNNGTQITAGRVDLGPAKMYLRGQTIDVRGNPDSGFRISRSSDRSQPGASRTPQAALTSMPYDMLKNAHPEQTTTVMVAPGVFDQRSLSPVQGPDGSIVGYRQMVARYTALSPDKMLVQINVGGTPDQNSTPGFSMSGYLRKNPIQTDESPTTTK